MTCIAVMALHLSLTSGLPAQVLSQPVTDSSAITVAVLDFKNNSGMFSLDALEKSIPEMLKTELSRAKSRLLVVERQKLEAILQEQALSQTGVIDEKTAQTVGQLAGAEYLLTGEISSLADSKLRIDCHILKVATGQVRGEKVIGHNREALDEMVRLLASNTLHNLTGEGQHRERLRLKNYPSTWFWLATALTSAAIGVTHFVSRDEYDQYQAATKLDEFDTHYDRASNFRKARNGLAIASGVLALTSISLWLKSRSEGNQIFALTAPSKIAPAREMIVFANEGAVGIGLRWHL
jgi:TolB-like protein